MKKLFLSLVLCAGIHKNIQCSDSSNPPQALRIFNGCVHGAVAAKYFHNAATCNHGGYTVGNIFMGTVEAGIAAISLRSADLSVPTTSPMYTNVIPAIGAAVLSVSAVAYRQHVQARDQQRAQAQLAAIQAQLAPTQSIEDNIMEIMEFLEKL